MPVFSTLSVGEVCIPKMYIQRSCDKGFVKLKGFTASDIHLRTFSAHKVGTVPGGIPIKKGQGWSSYLSGLKKAVLVALRLFSVKMTTAEALAIPFRVLSRKIMTEDIRHF